MLQRKLKTFKNTFAREEVRAISRRYFISNGFDGTLTSIGITVGALLSGVPDGITVFKIGVGAAIGLATSGVWSVWEIERAEKQAEIHEMEAAMLTDLSETEVGRRKREARAVNALMSGIGPTIGILLPVLPFLLEGVYLSMLQATLVSVLVGVGVLFAFGVYMAEVSKQTWYVAGIRMGLAGLVVALLNVVLPG